jgi:uncharacterized protein DUF5134
VAVDARRVPELLAAALLPVVLYCTARAVTRRAGGALDGHHRDLDVWHVVMGVAMIAMLLGRMPAAATVPVLMVSALAVAWGVRAMQPSGSASAYARLAVGGAAMAVMVPMAPAQAATGGPTGDHAAGAAMTTMSHAVWAPLGVVLLVVLVSAFSSAAWVILRPGGVVRRLDASCDVVMALAMAAMLVQVL